MNSKELMTSIKNGERIYGSIISSTHPRWPLEVSKAGIDFIFIDTEHIPADRETLAWMCQGYKAYNIAPFVRIPTTDPGYAYMVLDGGANGVIVPYVETAEQVRVLVGAVKYRPLKGEKLFDILNGKSNCGEELEAYLRGRNENNFLIIMIESEKALKNFDEILKVPGLDAVFVGPHDLTCSLGIPEQYKNPVFTSAVSQIIKKCNAHNIAVGIPFSVDIEQEIGWVREGANIIMHSADFKIFSDYMQKDIKRIKDELAGT